MSPYSGGGYGGIVMSAPSPNQPPNHTTVVNRSPADAARRARVRTGRMLFLLGLVLVAALSSVVWWSIRHDAGGEPNPQAAQPSSRETSGGGTQGGDKDEGSQQPQTLRAGHFTFEALAPVQTSERCDRVSYGKVRSWFADHPCREVVRGLFSVQEGSRRAAVSVVLVTLPSEQRARQLKKLTDTNGTGNVSDLIKDGTVQLPGVPKVAGGNYASGVVGPRLTIVEASFYGNTKKRALLNDITAAAVQLGTQLR